MGCLYLSVRFDFVQTTILPFFDRPAFHLYEPRSFLCLSCRGNSFLKKNEALEAPEVGLTRVSVNFGLSIFFANSIMYK